ncbi:MAG: hypothetical protein GX763_02740 [Clostridiaceae bacterium]|nr:hypothetical protein [Clostridiaceae bacterium]
MKKKRIAMLIAVAMLIVGVIGLTIAWLTDKTDPVKNTFSPSDINITLTESDDLDLKMIPGYTIKKDPLVTVKANSEKAFVFVKLEKSANFDSFMSYTMAEGWTQLTGVDNVWYRVVDAPSSTNDLTFQVIEDDKVVVKNTVTKAMMNALTEATYPTLTVTAYASQFAKDNTNEFTAAEAWGNLNP